MLVTWLDAIKNFALCSTFYK